MRCTDAAVHSSTPPLNTSLRVNYLFRQFCALAAFCLLYAVSSSGIALASTSRPLVDIYEQSAVSPGNAIDQYIAEVHTSRGLQFAPECADGVFLRRIYLDLTGTLPLPHESMDFIKDRRVDKRRVWIDKLLADETTALYQSLRWGDLLRLKSEFPVNLWPNAVQAYGDWILQAQRNHLPYDEFARELLLSSGSNFRVPQVNFYRAVSSKDAAGIAGAVGQIFMGTRLQAWPEAERRCVEAFFVDVAYKPTAEWKEEIVYRNPAAYGSCRLTLPDGDQVEIAAGADKRVAFVDWLLAPQNPWFARAAVNREWAWLFGRGLVHEPDDLRPDNPALSDDLLDYLARELVDSGYDLRHVRRLILNSRTYQQSFIPAVGPVETAETLFACYPLQRMDAEVLADALCLLTGSRETYMSRVPEPFTHIPADQRSIALTDGSISSSFLELFGRPSRDTGLFTERDNEPTEKQCLHLLNSTHIQKKLSASMRVKNLLKGSESQQRKQLRWAYMTLYSRWPTENELELLIGYAEKQELSRVAAGQDIFWTLLNSKEFLYNH